MREANDNNNDSDKRFLPWGIHMQTQFGIAAYLRNLAVRCNRIARACPDAKTHDALAELTAELADKAEVLEHTFRIPKNEA